MNSPVSKRKMIAVGTLLILGLTAGSVWAADQPIIAAAKAGDVARLRAILQARPQDIKATDPSQSATPLHWAVINGHRPAAFFLLSQGAPAKAGDRTGFTPLHYAAYAGLPAVALALLKRGADVNAIGGWIKVTPLHLAALQARLITAAILLAHGAKVQVRDNMSRTPLDYATGRGHWMFVVLLAGYQR